MAEADRTIAFYQTVQGCIIPGGFSADAFATALKYVPRDDDLFIATYPKCGTTWTQQIVYLILNKGKPPVSSEDFFLRNPFLDLAGIEAGENMVRPGAIKVHLPFQLTPHSSKAKYLCAVRNPYDTAVSYYHHMITDPCFTFQEGTFESFFEDFINGRTAYNDYFDHVLSWYEHRNDPNVLLFTYEEMKKDTIKTVLKIAEFMGKEWFDMLAEDKEVLRNVVRFSSLEYMKTQFNVDFQVERPEEAVVRKLDPGVEHYRNFASTHSQDTDEKFHFVRTGKVAGWRNVLSEQQAHRLAEKTERKLKGTCLYEYWKSIGCV